MHHGTRRDRGLTTAVETFVRVPPALQCRRAAATARRASKATRPASLEQECRAGRLIGKRLILNCVSDRALAIGCPAIACPAVAYPGQDAKFRSPWDNGISHMSSQVMSTSS
jgi:hypothetical protein